MLVEAQPVEDFARDEIGEVVNGLGLLVKRRHRRQDHRAGFGGSLQPRQPAGDVWRERGLQALLQRLEARGQQALAANSKIFGCLRDGADALGLRFRRKAEARMTARLARRLPLTSPDQYRRARDLLVTEYAGNDFQGCLLYTSPSPRDRTRSRMPPSACKTNNTHSTTHIYPTK